MRFLVDECTGPVVAGWLRGFALPRCLALAARIGAAAVAVAGDWEGYPTAQEVGL